MPTPVDPAAAREFAVETVRRLREAGFEALWAGGCVRDQVLGLVPKDYDVATSATPQQVRELFGKRKTLAIGAAFGVICILGPREAGSIEVATFRRDAGYSDGRHPDSVTFSTAEEDAQRRDFTMNGLFFDPLDGRIIDYVGGQADIERKTVRAIRNPHERFAEDKLRMLRAVRFAATFGFEPEAETLAAMVEHSSEITVVSAERIAGEMRRMLVLPARVWAMELLKASQLLPAIWPEVAALSTTDWQRALALLGAVESPCFSLSVAAIMWPVIFPAKEPISPSSAIEELAKRWRLSNEEREIAEWALANESAIRSARSLPWPKVQRVLIAHHAEQLIRLAAAVVMVEGSDASGVEFCKAKLLLPREVLDPPPLITGNDLKRAGISPGPNYKELLERARDAQLEGIVTTKEELLAWAKQTCGSSFTPG